MPDSKVKVYYGEFPDCDVTEKLKLGEKLLWVPGSSYRGRGLGPTLYVVERRPELGPGTLLMPYPVHPAHLSHG